MGAIKTDRAIERASKAVGGVRKIVENFDNQICKHPKSSQHSHKSSSSDEKVILNDLRQLRPFTTQANRAHQSFLNMSSEPLQSLNNREFCAWLARHKRNMMAYAPMEDDAEDDAEDEENQ